MNLVAQEKLLYRLARQNPKVRHFLRCWQKDMLCSEYKNEEVRVGWIKISDSVIRNLDLRE